MRYALVAAAWLIAWGAFAPQDAGAGFVLCVDESMSAAAPDAPQSLTDVSNPSRPSETELLLDRAVGLIEVPSGAQAPSTTSQSRLTMPAWRNEGAQESLSRSSISSRLPLNRMFSLRMMYKSAVFRPPRA